MKFNCVHTFTIEAESREEFDERLAAYARRVKVASERLDIGYAAGLMCGQAASDRYNEPKEETPLERLFEQ